LNPPQRAALAVAQAVEQLRLRAVASDAVAVAEDLGKMSRAAETLCALLSEVEERLLEAADAEDRRRLRHDLRTPVNQILGFCELIQEETEDAGDRQWQEPLAGIHLRTQALLEEIAALGDLTGSEATIPASGGPLTAGVPRVVEDRGSMSGLIGSGPVVLRGEDERPGTVLIVDDNPQNREMLERRLRRDGLDVLTAADGAEALEVVAQMAVDVVLLDIMMPVMDGYETLERLKSDGELRHLPVIMLTSLDEPESIRRCIEAGAEDHLPKPFDPVLLRARIGSSLERKKVRDLERAYLRRIVAEKRRADDLIHGVIPIGVALSAERDLNRLLERVLTEARRFCGADGGALLLRHSDRLEYVLVQCASIELFVGGARGSVVELPPIVLDGTSDVASPAARATREGVPINVPQVDGAEDIDPRSIRAFDEVYGYITQSMVALPLREVDGDVIGVLMLWNATRATDGRVIAFEDDTIEVLESLSSLAGAALDSFRRETELRRQIRRLEIRIDDANRRREVSEITETAYFRKLRDMAQKLRGGDGESEDGTGG
jgi:CheY-like chemotaxis protein